VKHWLLASLIFVACPALWSAELTGVVSSVKVSGNKTVSQEQVLAVTSLRPGDPLLPSAVSEDIKRIWKMGLFSNVEAEVEQGPGGLEVVYGVTERPILKEIQFFGNKAYGDSELKEKSGLKENETYDQKAVAEAVDKIVRFYKERDFYAASVRTELKPSEDAGKAILRFQVTEGFKMKIRKVVVTGNKVFSEGKIKGEMQDTKEASWFFSIGGAYDREKLEQDLKRVLAAYNREGYLKSKLEGYSLDEFPDHAREVSEKVTRFDEEKKQIEIAFHVQEGAQYALHSLSLTGNVIYGTEEVLSHFDSRPGQTFNRERWERDLGGLRALYAEKGYIYANPNPSLHFDDAKGLVDAKMDLSEGNVAYIEQIKIRGNEITKDKVIRRELLIKEGEAFDTAKISKSREKVFNLGFFENVAIDTEPGSEMDKQVLVFDVSPERKTGTLSLGAGYSSVEGLVGYLQVSQNNLFGNGQSVSAQWEAGNFKHSYSVSFTEPWLFDTPTSFGVDLFNRTLAQGYNSQGYDLNSVGGALRLGRILDPTWKVFATYRYETDDYENIISSLQPLINQGINNVSSLTPSLVRDTRDNIFDASRGTYNVWSLELAGGYLGGDNNFVKPVYDSSIYFSTPPLFGWNWLKKFTLGAHGRVGFARGFDAGRGNTDVPPAERFFVGGTDTVRGYLDRSLGASATGGGRFLLLSNVEYGFRPVDPLKLRAFYDSGNTWNDIGDVQWDAKSLYLYPAAGLGFLFTIPGSVIQIRLDWGYALDPGVRVSSGVSGGRIHFNIGNIF
jgi:outer membrane protein insertion porin family